MAKKSAEKIGKFKAPFPWFGGKSRVAHAVWERFGDVKNYVEPFAGSLAVLLGRPHEPKIETVNDKDCYLANFWRALQADPVRLAKHSDAPVNEADLHARHQWLVNQEDFRERMKVDPDYFDVKVAGWWVWGLSAWIGGEWCAVRSRVCRRIPDLRSKGVHRRRPHLFRYGSGINALSVRDNLLEYFAFLASRLRRTRVCCGDWKRVCTPSPTYKLGLTGVLLDPPYAAEAERSTRIYATDDLSVSAAVREWAIENGGNPLLRIAVCGYEGEHNFPRGWKCVPWLAHGGMSWQSENGKHENRARERIWFSPHCLPSKRGRQPAAGGG